jgi:uncharacterized protein (TIGR02996 family)
MTRMTDDERAFRAAICAQRSDDLPRLVFADWLEEHDDPDRARMIRTQCEWAALPSHDRRRIELAFRALGLLDGRDYHALLPTLNADCSWGETFRRGFGWSVHVRWLPALFDAISAIETIEPFGELFLPTATLNEWRFFGTCPWLNAVESIHFTGITTPIEPLRVLGDSLQTERLTEISTLRGDSPAMPSVIEALLQSPLGRRLRKLTIRNAVNCRSLIQALAQPLTHLEELTLPLPDLTDEDAREFIGHPLFEHLQALRLYDHPLGSTGLFRLCEAIHGKGLSILELTDTRITHVTPLANVNLEHLRVLNLSNNHLLRTESLEALVTNTTLGNLRVLSLRNCGVPAEVMNRLTQAPFWKTLHQLDLRGNPAEDLLGRFVLNAEPPPELEVLLLPRLSTKIMQQLDQHFPTAVLVCE